MWVWATPPKPQTRQSTAFLLQTHIHLCDYSSLPAECPTSSFLLHKRLKYMSVRRDLYETCSQPLHKAGISPPILQMSCRGVGAACSLQARAEGVCKRQVFPSLGGAGVETGQKQGLSVAQAFLIQSKQIKPGKRAGKPGPPTHRWPRQLRGEGF